MADDWEDWENDDNLPQLPSASKPPAAAAVADKFAGEDEEEEEPEWKRNVPAPQQPKENKKKTYEDKGRVEVDEPLDDPIAEKLRRQKLVEEADLQNARELFGGAGEVNLDTVPKSLKDHEELGRNVANRFLVPYGKNQHYKSLLKALLRQACTPVGNQEVKDLETCLAGIRSDKLKEEKAAKAGATGGKKKSLNVGNKGGSAGLDDYKFDAPLDDDYDFM